VGIDWLIKNADYVINGNKSTDEVFETTRQFIEEQ